MALGIVARRSLLVSCLLIGGVCLQSCLFVKAPKKESPQVDHVEQSPLPAILMGDELVRTAKGDMISLLPKGWVLLDPTTAGSDDVLAVAVDPDYTMSAVFASIPVTPATTGAVEADGLLGLARIAFGNHQRKTGGNVSLVQSYAIDTLGTRMFGTYRYASATTSARCAVYTSTLGNHYEFAVIPLQTQGRELPTERVQEQLFKSILATIQY
ncbi:MAG: hypothetical protein J5I53_07615 [Bradyrhizobiaceae bacterium]|nr:hypothetical protein [Bradyrhizobiaceae bacterium]